MSTYELHSHRQNRVGWLRAAVLGANDGIVSTASLIIGVAAAGSTHQSIIIAGIAGLVAGAISMAAGEYVSVCAQQDTERADLKLEKTSLAQNYELEVKELANIYQQRGLEEALSVQVARQLMEYDALAAHARDDIGISDMTTAQPLLAALASALSFTFGAIVPILLVWIIEPGVILHWVAACSLVTLAFLGACSAYLSGAPIYIGIARVTIWGMIAMVSTAVIGDLFDTSIF